jgi:hypothetical protein
LTRLPAARDLVWVVLAIICIAVVATVVLLPYGDRTHPPLSYDTPYYVWRTRAVAEGGLDVLTRIPAGPVNPHRPGFPILGSIMGTLTGTDALTFAVIIRAVAAVTMGLAAGAMARESLREPPWAMPAFVIGLGLSAAVLGTAVENLEQLLVDIFLVPLVVAVPLVAWGKKGVVAAAAFLAAAAATHWVFTGLFLGLVLGTGVIIALLPRSGERGRWPGPPAVRILKLFGLLVVVGVVVFLVLPAPPNRLPPVLGEGGNVRRLGAYEIPLVFTVAGLGLIFGLRRSEEPRRSTVVLLGLWAATLPVAMIASEILPTQMKLFRVAPFALGAPLLATLALVGIVRLAKDRAGRLGAAGGALLLVAGLALLAGTPSAVFEEPSGVWISGRVAQGRIAGRYLALAGEPGRPVIFLTRTAPRLVDRAVRASVPAWLLEDTWVYVGTPKDLATRAPADDPGRRRLSRLSKRWWRTAWPRPADVFRRDPIVIALGTPVLPPPAKPSDLAPGISLIQGPELPSFVPPPRIHFTWYELLTATALCLVALGAVGAGWSRALFDVPLPSALALAPASGAAALILGGLVAGRAGAPLAGGTAFLLAVAMAGSGWVVFALRRRIARHQESPGSDG